MRTPVKGMRMTHTDAEHAKQKNIDKNGKNTSERREKTRTLTREIDKNKTQHNK